MNLFKSFTYKSFFIIILFLLSLIISLHLPGYNWETDYGHHYYISMFNDKFLNLYENFHFHKGPVSIFLLDIIGLIIGYGWKQSIIAYSIFIFLFLILGIFIVIKNYKNIFFVLLSTIFILTFFRSQGSNIFHELVVNIFLLSSIYFFYNYLIDQNKKNIFYFSFFFSTAILTRIDTLIYSFPFLSLLIIVFYKKKKLRDLNLTFFLQNLSIFLSIFFLLSILYNFSINDFLLNNIYFNLEYSNDYKSFKSLSYLYHLLPNKIILFVIFIKSMFYLSEDFSNQKIFKYLLFSISLTQFFLFLLKINEVQLFILVFIIEIILVTYFFLKYNQNNINLILTLYLLLTSILIYLKAGSFKLNHVFILLPGFFYFYCFFIKYLFTSNIKFKYLLILILALFSLDQSYKIFNSVKNPIVRNSNLSFANGVNNLFYNENVIKDNTLVKKINKYNAPVLCDRPWPHIFNQKQSIGFMFDWWMYDDNKKSINKKAFKKFYNNLLKKHYGDYYILDKSCIDNYFSKSDYLKELKNQSFEVEEFNFFKYRYSLRQFYE